MIKNDVIQHDWLEELRELVNQIIEEREIKDREDKCSHEFIPMFNTICCKHCGTDIDDM